MCGRYYIDERTDKETERLVNGTGGNDTGRIDAGRIDSDGIDAGRIGSGRIDSGKVDSGKVDSGRKSAEKGQKRDIFPSEPSMVLTLSGDMVRREEMHWGFPGYHGKELIINARSETALTKKTFRDSILNRRCVISASGFYEWNASKEKVIFCREDSSPLYMAGIYNRFPDSDRFVILTTSANESIVDVHDRMPLILEQDEIFAWLFDSSRTEEFLRKIPTSLKRDMAYEQLRLPL